MLHQEFKFTMAIHLFIKIYYSMDYLVKKDILVKLMNPELCIIE